MSGAELIAAEFAAAMREVMATAAACTDEEWSRPTPGDGRTVGVLFDHIADGNLEVVRWIGEFLAGRDVPMTPDELHSANAAHARRAQGRPRGDTVDDLRVTSAIVAALLDGLDADDLAATGSFAFMGPTDVRFLAGTAPRHPRGHLAVIRTALGT